MSKCHVCEVGPRLSAESVPPDMVLVLGMAMMKCFREHDVVAEMEAELCDLHQGLLLMFLGSMERDLAKREEELAEARS